MSYLQPHRTAFADDVRGLSRAEHLVLFGVRAAALGHEDCPALHRTFAALLGGEADAALCNLLVFVRVVGASTTRRLRLHAPGCCAVADDERLVLWVIAAAQASLADGRDDELRAHLAELLDHAPCEASLMAAQCLAAALTLSGLHLPPACAPPSPARTLH